MKQVLGIKTLLLSLGLFGVSAIGFGSARNFCTGIEPDAELKIRLGANIIDVTSITRRQVNELCETRDIRVLPAFGTLKRFSSELSEESFILTLCSEKQVNLTLDLRAVRSKVLEVLIDSLFFREQLDATDNNELPDVIGFKSSAALEAFRLKLRGAITLALANDGNQISIREILNCMTP